MLLALRMEEVTEDILLTDDDKEVLRSKAEYSALNYLYQWVETHAGKDHNGR